MSCIVVNLPEMTEEKEIHEFMSKHVTSDLQMKADISVKDLRRIIPIMIMHIFSIREERTQKKGTINNVIINAEIVSYKVL